MQARQDIQQLIRGRLREHGFEFCDDPYAQRRHRDEILDAVNAGSVLQVRGVEASSTDHETQVVLTTQ